MNCSGVDVVFSWKRNVDMPAPYEAPLRRSIAPPTLRAQQVAVREEAGVPELQHQQIPQQAAVVAAAGGVLAPQRGHRLGAQQTRALDALRIEGAVQQGIESAEQQPRHRNVEAALAARQDLAAEAILHGGPQ